MYEKFKGFLKEDTVFYGLLILLVGTSSFGLGKYSTGDEVKNQANVGIVQENRLTEPNLAPVVTTSINPAATETQYVASKNATKYHLLWCPGAKQMKEENKIYFNSKEAAETAGYTPAANCKGI